STHVDGAAVDQINVIAGGAAADRYRVITLDVDGAFIAKVKAAAQINERCIRVDAVNHAGCRVPNPDRIVTGVCRGNGAVTVGRRDCATVNLGKRVAGTRQVNDGIFTAFYCVTAVGQRCTLLVIEDETTLDQ